MRSGLALLAAACAREPPSVLLVTLDTTRADRLGPYGYALAATPAYDDLAAGGTVFTRAYSTCPLTIPSHSTILTGLPPPSHGVHDNGDFVLGPDVRTLAERLGEAGWSTAAFTAAFPTQRRWGFDQGFDVYHDPLGRIPTRLDWSDERRAAEVVDDALDTLPSLPGPVFAWVHLFDAHWPYEPPEPYATLAWGRPYDGELASAAAEVERLVQAWDAARPRSVVVLTADHGEGMGDGGELTHGFLLHDGTIRVPLVVRARGLDAFASGERVSDPVSHVDIVPTVLALVGLPPDPALPGRDLRQGGSEVAFSEARTGLYNLGLAPLSAFTDAAGRYMVGARGEWYPAVGDRVLAGPDPLFDLSPEAERLRALVAAFPAAAEAPAAALDAQGLQMLMALGYVGGNVAATPGTIDPRDVIDVLPLTWRMRQAMGAGRAQVAESMLHTLEARLPGTWGVDLLRAQFLRRQGRDEEALPVFVELFRRAPSSTVALQVADLFGSFGDFSEAETWYREALALQPASPEAMGGIVRALLAQGEVEAARESAEQYLGVYPDHAEIVLMRARLLLADGRTAEARAEAEYALRSMPWSPEANAVVADALWEDGRADLAIDRLQEALRIDPGNLPYRLRLAERLLEVGRNAEAVRAVAPVARLRPEDERTANLHRRAVAALEAETAR